MTDVENMLRDEARYLKALVELGSLNLEIAKVEYKGFSKGIQLEAMRIIKKRINEGVFLLENAIPNLKDKPEAYGDIMLGRDQDYVNEFEGVNE